MRHVIVGLGTFCITACGGSTPPPASLLVAPASEPAPVLTTSGRTAPVATADLAPASTGGAIVRDPDREVEAVRRSTREISPTDHAVDAHALAVLLDDEDALLRLVRLVPDPPGGTGIRLFGIRADDLLVRLGFEKGDRVERLMGRPTSTVDEARAAFAAVRGAALIVVDIERRGVRQQVVIRAE